MSTRRHFLANTHTHNLKKKVVCVVHFTSFHHRRSTMGVDEVMAQISAQADKVKGLKAAKDPKTPKDVIKAAVDELLALKAQLPDGELTC